MYVAPRRSPDARCSLGAFFSPLIALLRTSYSTHQFSPSISIEEHESPFFSTVFSELQALQYQWTTHIPKHQDCSDNEYSERWHFRLEKSLP